MERGVKHVAMLRDRVRDVNRVAALDAPDSRLSGARRSDGIDRTSTAHRVHRVTRGFDRTGDAFRYDGNSRFGPTRRALTLERVPFGFATDSAVDLRTDFEVRSLRRALEPVRPKPGEHAAGQNP
jgi:hypothetical protein